MRERTSIIWKMPLKKFQALVAVSTSLRELLAYFSLQNKGGNYKTLMARIQEEGIDISHIKNNKNKYRSTSPKGYPLDRLLRRGVSFGGQRLLKKCVQAGILSLQCEVCKQGPQWQKHPLVLVLDHRNGDPTDNRRANLRVLCPNCHSQTTTFAGRKLKGSKRSDNAKSKHYCPLCGKQCSRGAKKGCASCIKKLSRKVIRPPRKQLLQEVSSLGFCGTARKYGVTDNAIRKWIDPP